MEIAHRSFGFGGGYQLATGTDNRLYLRITSTLPQVGTTPPLETGSEAFIVDAPLNCDVAGSLISWYALVNRGNAMPSNTAYFPIGAEWAGGGGEATDFDVGLLAQVFLTQHDSVTTSTTVTGVNVLTIHQYRIVVVTPGGRIDFYVDGVLKASNTTNIPTGLNSPLGEVETASSSINQICVDVFGGMPIP